MLAWTHEWWMDGTWWWSDYIMPPLCAKVDSWCIQVVNRLAFMTTSWLSSLFRTGTEKHVRKHAWRVIEVCRESVSTWGVHLVWNGGRLSAPRLYIKLFWKDILNYAWAWRILTAYQTLRDVWKISLRACRLHIMIRHNQDLQENARDSKSHWLTLLIESVCFIE